MTKSKVDVGFLGSVGGVAVVQDKGNYEVGFSFSNQLVSKMKAVEGANYDREAGCWIVPEASAAQLGDVVADMRDFVANNGVQVKDIDGGGKQVLFDYDKRLTQVIGAVNGAEFDGVTRAWNVPANSKALGEKDGGTSYFDLAINKMRGMAIEAAKDREGIKDLAAEAAATLGAEPGIYYPEPEQTYKGEIAKVNGSCAVQVTEVKDTEKGKVAFMVIHDLDKLGDVFKGDKLYIAYDGKMHADVRTVDLVQQQQADRVKLEATAKNLVDGADVKNASAKGNSKYSGEVKKVADSMILLSGGRNAFTMHRRDLLAGADIKEGMKLDVSYKDGKGYAVDAEKQKGQGQGAAR